MNRRLKGALLRNLGMALLRNMLWNLGLTLGLSWIGSLGRRRKTAARRIDFGGSVGHRWLKGIARCPSHLADWRYSRSRGRMSTGVEGIVCCRRLGRFCRWRGELRAGRERCGRLGSSVPVDRGDCRPLYDGGVDSFNHRPGRVDDSSSGWLLRCFCHGRCAELCRRRRR